MFLDPDAFNKDARILMHQIGMPETVPWCRIGTPAPIKKSSKAQEIRIELGGTLQKQGALWNHNSESFDPTLFKGWTGYRWEYFAALWNDIHGGRPESFWRLANHEVGITVDIPIWCRRAFFRDSPIFAEILWHPEQGEDARIRGPVESLATTDIRRAQHGLKLLGALQIEERKRERSHRSRADHLAQAIRAARHFQNDPVSPREPTEQDICDFIAAEEGIACTRSTLTHRWRRLADYGEEIITIDEVKRIARQ